VAVKHQWCLRVRQSLIPDLDAALAYDIESVPCDTGHGFRGREIQRAQPAATSPVYIDDRVSVSDSTVICEYLEERHRPRRRCHGPAERAVAEDLPEAMGHLERLAPASDFLCGEVSIADVSVATFFSNLRWARVEPSTERRPKTLAWVDRTRGVPALAKITRVADAVAKHS
jgi:glutathione S-transferase